MLINVENSNVSLIGNEYVGPVAHNFMNVIYYTNTLYTYAVVNI